MIERITYYTWQLLSFLLIVSAVKLLNQTTGPEDFLLPKLHHIYSDKYDWFKIITATTIGGIFTYFFIRGRDKKDREEVLKQNIIQSLRDTQFSIILQMNNAQGIRSAIELLNIKFPEINRNSLTPSQISLKLEEIESKNQTFYDDLKSVTQFVITDPLNDQNIKVPSFKDVRYAQQLVACTKSYKYILGRLNRTNYIRDKYLFKIDINIPDLINVAGGVLEFSHSIRSEIEKYFTLAEKCLNETIEHIESLGGSPIPVPRDSEGNIIYDRDIN